MAAMDRTITGQGRILGDFRILRELGRGGMGVVYLAEQISLRRKVALKVLPDGAGLTRSQTERFLREAEAASRLDHPNIVPIHGVGTVDGVRYIAMKYVEGTILDAGCLRSRHTRAALPDTVAEAGGRPDPDGPEAADGPMDPDDGDPARGASPCQIRWVVTIARKVALALDHAHSQGIIHRDIKPANIIVDAHGEPFILDFGLALDVRAQGLTMAGDLVGTPLYLAPERITGDRDQADPSSDVYSLGVTLYEVLAGRPPFSGPTQHATIQRILGDEPVPLRRLNPAVPADVATVIRKAMEKNPRDRYATAAALAEDLRRILDLEPILAAPAGPVTRFRKYVARRPVHAALWSLLVFLIAGGSCLGGVMAWKRRADERILHARVDRDLQMADEALRRQLVREARDLYSRVIEVDGSNARARAGLRECAIAALLSDTRTLIFSPKESDGSMSEALDDLAAAEALGGRRPEILALRGAVCLVTGRYDEALGTARGLQRAGATRHALLLRMRALQAKKETEAALEAERALRALPVLSDADRLLEAEFAFIVGRPEEALAACRDILDRDPSNSWAAFVASRCEHDLGRYGEALHWVNICRVRHGTPNWILRNRADLLRHLGRYPLAHEEIRLAIFQDPTDHHAYVMQALVWESEGRHTEALASLRTALEQRPQCGWARLNLATTLSQLGRHAEAEQELRDHLRTQPGSARAWQELGRVLRTTRRFDDAAEAFGRAAAHEESKAAALLERGRTRLRQRRFDDALADLAAAAAAGSASCSIPVLEAEALLGLRRHGEAEARARKAIADRKDNADAHYALGNILLDTARHEEAIAAFSRAAAIDPGFAQVLCNRGVARERLGDTEGALRDYAAALEASPELPEARRNRTSLLFRLDRHDTAIEDLRRLVERRPGAPDLSAALVSAEIVAGRAGDALADIEAALDRFPRHPDLRSHRARALAAAGDADAAVAEFEAILAEHPRNVTALMAFSTLLEDRGELGRSLLLHLEGHRHASDHAGHSFAEIEGRISRIAKEEGEATWALEAAIAGLRLLERGAAEEAAAWLREGLDILATKPPPVAFDTGHLDRFHGARRLLDLARKLGDGVATARLEAIAGETEDGAGRPESRPRD